MGRIWHVTTWLTLLPGQNGIEPGTHMAGGRALGAVQRLAQTRALGAHLLQPLDRQVVPSKRKWVFCTEELIYLDCPSIKKYFQESDRWN